MSEGITKKEKQKRIRKVLLISLGICVAGVTVYILAINGISVPCIFHKLTGFLCPGCGNTRAAMALFRLDFAAAFSFNPMFPVEFFYLAWVYIFACRTYIREKRFSYNPPWQIVDIIVLIIITVGTVIRNIPILLEKLPFDLTALFS